MIPFTTFPVVMFSRSKHGKSPWSSASVNDILSNSQTSPRGPKPNQRHTHRHPTGKSALPIAGTKINWHTLFDTVKISF